MSDPKKSLIQTTNKGMRKMNSEEVVSILQDKTVKSALVDIIARGVVFAGVFVMVMSFACGMAISGLR